MLVTNRLILRPWTLDDAEECYKYCSDPKVGPIAGWPTHKSIEETREVITNVFSNPGTFALVIKETGLPVGCISIKRGEQTDLTSSEDECELGYWLGVPYWGKGLMPEAVNKIIEYCFEELGMKNILCGYYDGNLKSKKVQEKCGFKHLWTTERVEVKLMNEYRKGHVNILSREDWLKKREIAASVDPINARRSYRGTYYDAPVPRKDLMKIVEAGIAAPSGCNKQTTSFVIVDDPEVLGKLRSVMVPPVAETAPAAVCVMTSRINAYRDKCFAVQDYSAAIENMLLRIAQLGYSSCWYEGHITDDDRICDKMKDILGAPDDMDLVCFLPVGIATAEAKAPSKKDISERVFYNGFDNSK